MGCNLSQLRKMKDAATNDEASNKKVLFLGLDNAGKSTLLFQLKDKTFRDTVPTVGLNVDKINAIIFVVDSADLDRMERAQEELHRVICDEELSNAPVLIFANK